MNILVDDKLEVPKYQYHVLTWGGFYNEEHKVKHGLNSGDYVFDTIEERTRFIEERKLIEEKLNARLLCFHLTEGFCCNVRTKLHRVVDYEGKQYYSERDLGVNYEFEYAKSLLEDKWYPGFNDYPLGEDFEHYDKVLIVKEWITGAYQSNVTQNPNGGLDYEWL